LLGLKLPPMLSTNNYSYALCWPGSSMGFMSRAGGLFAPVEYIEELC
jgi:hypothetical protein